MYLTGFADEAGKDIDTQIKATKELGWKWIESRNIDGKNIHDISDEDFDEVCRKLDQAGVGINCFGSAIANWGKKITDPFDDSLAETRRAIPRMQKLGTKLIRIMSFAIRKNEDGTACDDQMEDERFRRLRELVQMFTDAGITPVHENCMNYGGMGPDYTLKLIESVPGLKLVFDTANPVNTPDYAKGTPYPRQDPLAFYQAVKEHVAYLHIKDSRFIEDTGGIFPKSEFTFPGEGDGKVREIVKDLLDGGYDGGISMEPHLAVVYHDDSVTSDEEIKYRNYVEYGRRFMKLLEEIGHGDKV
jgi:sugar phosphate isomerase/epimerase